MFQNFKKRLTESGRYDKEQRTVLHSYIWQYIQAPTIKSMQTAKVNLLFHLHRQEQDYIYENWDDKEAQVYNLYISTQQVVPSTPQIVPLVVEKPVIQEFVPPALDKFRQKKIPKEKLIFFFF